MAEIRKGCITISGLTKGSSKRSPCGPCQPICPCDLKIAIKVLRGDNATSVEIPSFCAVVSHNGVSLDVEGFPGGALNRLHHIFSVRVGGQDTVMRFNFGGSDTPSFKFAMNNVTELLAGQEFVFRGAHLAFFHRAAKCTKTIDPYRCERKRWSTNCEEDC